MTTPIPVLPDVRAEVTNRLRELLGDAAAEVGNRLPPPRAPTPFVMIVSDALTPWRWPAAAYDLIRVTVWADDEDTAHDVAALAGGRLLAHRGGMIRSVRGAPGALLSATDPDTQQPMSSFVVRVNTYPTTE